NFRAYSFAFALEIQSKLIQFEVPVVFPEFGPPVLPSIPQQVGQQPLPEGFTPPQVRPVQWSCADLAEDVARGLQYVQWQGRAGGVPSAGGRRGRGRGPGGPPATRGGGGGGGGGGGRGGGPRRS